MSRSSRTALPINNCSDRSICAPLEIICVCFFAHYMPQLGALLLQNFHRNVFMYAKIFSKLRRICKSRYFTLSRGNRYDRRALLFSGVGQVEKKQDKREKPLGSKVLVIYPIPVFTIGHSGKSIVRSLRGTENPYERRNWNPVR